MTIYYSEPIKIEVKGRSVFVNDEIKEFSVRNFSEMNDVFIQKQPVLHDFPVYLMFRALAEKSGLRYDITIIPPKNFVGEYAKTYGHYHPIAEGRLSYPEIYQILSGKAFFILQKKRSDESVDVIITHGRKGDVIFVPPNWGHVTINATLDEILVIGNLIAEGFESDYKEYKENRGAAYYITNNGMEPNNHYFIRATEKKKNEEINAKYGLVCSDLLKEFWNNSEKFEFLKKPSLITK